MAQWGLDSLLDDIEFVRTQIAAVHPTIRPVVGGVSLGSMLGLAAAGRHPDDYAGVLAIEGAIYDTDPAARAITAAGCAAMDEALANGVFFDVQVAAFKVLAMLAATAPDEPSPLPGFPEGLTNLQVWVLTLSVPNPGPITPRPDYIFAAGDVPSGTLTFADPEYLQRSIAGFVNYSAMRTIRDVDCSLAGLDTSWTDDLGNFAGPVLMFAGGRGFGSAMTDTAALMTAAEVQLQFDLEFGHIDAYYATDHRKRMEGAVLHWLHHTVY